MCPPRMRCTTVCGKRRAAFPTCSCSRSSRAEPVMPQAPGGILEIRNIRKRLTDGRELLRGVSLNLRQGEFVGILGPSGAGKSLTIRCTLALTRPSEGEVTLHSRDGWTYSMDRIRGKRLRHARAQIGIIFQGLHLVKRLSVLENIMIGRLGRIHPLRS